MFHSLLIYTNNFCFGYITCFFETFPGWLSGWVVGKSDFNENPVVSLDLDFDFGLRLRVCQLQNNGWLSPSFSKSEHSASTSSFFRKVLIRIDSLGFQNAKNDFRAHAETQTFGCAFEAIPRNNWWPTLWRIAFSIFLLLCWSKTKEGQTSWGWAVPSSAPALISFSVAGSNWDKFH